MPEGRDDFDRLFAKVLKTHDSIEKALTKEPSSEERRSRDKAFDALCTYFTADKQERLRQLIDLHYVKGFFRLEGRRGKSLKRCLDFIDDVLTRSTVPGNKKGEILLPQQISFDTFVNFLNDIKEEKMIKS